MRSFKSALKSKTVWFAIILAVLSLLQGLVLEFPISPAWQAIIGMVLAIVVTVLRFVTYQPLHDK